MSTLEEEVAELEEIETGLRAELTTLRAQLAASEAKIEAAKVAFAEMVRFLPLGTPAFYTAKRGLDALNGGGQ